MIVTNALYAEIDRLTAQITKLEAEKDKLRDDLSMDKAILQNLLYREREEKRAIEDAMTDLQAAYNRLRARAKELEAERDSWKREWRLLNAALDMAEKRVAELEAEMREIGVGE